MSFSERLGFTNKHGSPEQSIGRYQNPTQVNAQNIEKVLNHVDCEESVFNGFYVCPLSMWVTSFSICSSSASIFGFNSIRLFGNTTNKLQCYEHFQNFIISTGMLGVCQSPRIVPPSPTMAEKVLPWKGEPDENTVCISSETTKIVPVDLQKSWKQSISSLESIGSPPAPDANSDRARGLRQEICSPPVLQTLPETCSCFPFTNSPSQGIRSHLGSADIQQQELQPLMPPGEVFGLSPVATRHSHNKRRLQLHRTSKIWCWLWLGVGLYFKILSIFLL